MTPDLQISWLDGDGVSDMLPQMCHFGIPKKSEKQQVLDGPCGHLLSAGSCPPHSLLMKKGAPSSPGATGMNRPCYPHSRPRSPPPFTTYTLHPLSGHIFHNVPLFFIKPSTKVFKFNLCHAKLTLHKLYVFLLVCLLLQRPSQDPRRVE